MNSTVLVIVVTFNPMKWVDKCLNSIRQSSIGLDAIIIDNKSTDGSQQYIADNYPEFRFIQNEKNEGFGRANNIGLKYALEHNYDYVYLLNQDAWIYPDTIENLIAEHQSNPRFGIISPLQLQANERHFDNNFGLFVSSWTNGRAFVERELGEGQTLFIVPFVMAAHWLISRECLLAVGGFSPSFYHYGEDKNYCDRAIFHGFSVGFSTKAKAIHDREDRTLSKEKKIFFTYNNWLVQLSSISSSENTSKIHIFKDSLFAARKFRSLSPLKYFWVVLSHSRQIRDNREQSRNRGAFM